MGGEAMSHTVYAAFAWQPRALHGCVENLLPHMVVHGCLRVTRGRKEPVFGPEAPPVALQLFEQYGGKQSVTVFASLALHDPDLHPGTINVLKLEMASFVQPQPGPVNCHQECPVF